MRLQIAKRFVIYQSQTSQHSFELSVHLLSYYLFLLLNRGESNTQPTVLKENGKNIESDKRNHERRLKDA